MSKVRLHLSRLGEALGKQGIKMKRSNLLQLCAAAFGYHNSNELTAADKRGDLKLEKADHLGVITMQGLPDLMLVRDPVANAIYAVQDDSAAHVHDQHKTALVVSPYGNLLRLEMPASPTILTHTEPRRQLLLNPSQTITIYAANVDHRHGQNSYCALTKAQLDDQIAEYCRENWSEIDIHQDPPDSASDTIERYFDVSDEVLTWSEPTTLTLPATGVGILADDGASPEVTTQSALPPRCQDAPSDSEAHLPQTVSDCLPTDTETDDDTGPFSVAVYMTDLAHGGSEEGGWNFQVGVLEQDPELMAYGGMFQTRQMARDHRDKIQTILDQEWNVGRHKYPISSTLSAGQYAAEVHAGWPPERYPAERPQYS